MKLFTYYNLSESLDVESVMKSLEDFSTDLKLDYFYDELSETFKLVDLDLSDKEIAFLQKLFEKNDVLPDLDCGDNHTDYKDLYGFDDIDYDF